MTLILVFDIDVILSCISNVQIPFFEDMACIALQYIDSLYQRDNMEKSNFFKGLTKVIEKLPTVSRMIIFVFFSIYE